MSGEHEYFDSRGNSCVGKDKFNLTHGSILGITHDFFNVLSFRHQARHPSISGAYFVGASAHPGTGVPIAIAGSRLCAEAVFADLGMPLPDTYRPLEREPKSQLDVLQSRKPLYVLEAWIDRNFPYFVGGLLASLVFAVLGVYTGKLDILDAFGRPKPTRLEMLQEQIGGLPLLSGLKGLSLPIEVIPWALLAFIAFVAPVLAKRLIKV